MLYRNRFRFILAALGLALLLTGLAFGPTRASAAPETIVGAVYTLTNATAGNAVLVFNRSADGRLHPAGQYFTQGLGTGSGLGSQGALVLSKNKKWLFAVNAGSNEITVFSVKPNGLTFASKTSSGGTMPISVTAHKDWLYVLDAGGNGNITGFTIGSNGTLSPIANSTQALSSSAAGPAQIQFNPKGTFLVVTEKSTNKIDTFAVNANGVAGAVNAQASSGTTPFGFDFDPRGQLIVSDAGGADSAVSSYDIDASGNLHADSPAVVAPGQQAACWLVVTKGGRYAYTANAHSGTISGYRIAEDGVLTLLNSNGVTANVGGAPLDLAITKGRFLYELNSSLHTIDVLRRQHDGSLVTLGSLPGVPAGVVGLAAR